MATPTAAGTQLAQDVSDADAAANRRFARDAAAERPRADDGGQHDEGYLRSPSRRSTHERVASSTSPTTTLPPRSARLTLPSVPAEPRGQRNGGSFGVGELIDELVDLTPPLLVEARF